MPKLSHLSSSIFSVMSQLAQTHGAINLAQGFPDFLVDARLLAIIEKKIKENVHQYTPMAGLPRLLENIAKVIQQRYLRTVDPHTELLITAGATQGVYTAIQTFIEKGDEVIILDPSYDSYEPSVLLANGEPIRVSLTNDFNPNFEAIAQAITDRTRMIVVNNPHNPTGKIWSKADLTAFETLMNKHPQILILSDEVYEFITFKASHLSFHLRKTLRDRCIIVSSFGKSLHVTGWKVGYLMAPQPLMHEIKKVHQFLVFSVNSVAQQVIADYLEIVDFDDISKMYAAKKQLFEDLVKPTPFELLACEGTYFQLLKYDKISSLADFDFAKELTIKHGVAAIPISGFYADGTDHQILRFCFAKSDETLIKAGERLSAL
jgi:methionine aminotransferase